MKLKPFKHRHAGLKLLAAALLGLSATHARANGTAPDLDGDGIPNIVDPDVDNDGLPNALDENVDGGIAKSGPYAGQYLGDHVNNDNPSEKDIDDDGLADDSLGETDTDGDAKTDADPQEADTDGDFRDDSQPAERDMDGDGRLDDELAEDDIDGDSLDDDEFVEDDIDGDNSSDSMDDDIDGDSRGNSVVDDDDIDGDGRANNADDETDDDGDGAHDRDDSDDNNDGIEDQNDDNHHGEPDEVEQKVDLSAGPAATAGSSARVALQSMASGQKELKITGRDFPEGSYDIVIAGIVRGTLAMEDEEGELRGETEFETGDDDHPLDFPVVGEAISLVQAGAVWFSGIIPTPPPPPVVEPHDDGHEHSYIQPLVRAAGLPAEAKAEAEVDIGLAGVVVFEVEMESMPVGAYEVTVDGTVRGTLQVVALPERNRGVLRFETAPDAPGELVLDFPVSGRPVTIRQAGTVFFSGTVPGGE
jgi:hypothetical protein